MLLSIVLGSKALKNLFGFFRHAHPKAIPIYGRAAFRVNKVMIKLPLSSYSNSQLHCEEKIQKSKWIFIDVYPNTIPIYRGIPLRD